MSGRPGKRGCLASSHGTPRCGRSRRGGLAARSSQAGAAAALDAWLADPAGRYLAGRYRVDGHPGSRELRALARVSRCCYTVRHARRRSSGELTDGRGGHSVRAIPDVVSGGDDGARGSAQLADYLQLAREAADIPLYSASDPADWPRNWADWQNALAWFDSQRSRLMTALPVVAEEGFERLAIELAFALERSLDNRRPPSEMLAVAAVAVAAAGRLADRVSEGRALTWQGVALFRLGRYQEALTACEHAMAIFRESGNRADEADALGVASPVLSYLGRKDEALASAREVVAIRQATGNRHAAGGAHTNLAFMLRSQRRLSEAVVAGRDAVAAYRETGDLYREGEALGVLGLVSFELGEIDESVASLTDAVRCYREFRDLAGQASMLRNLADVLNRERAGDAPAALRDAAEIYRQIGDRTGEAETLYALGTALAKAQSSGEAGEAFQSAAVIFGEIGDKEHEAQARAQAKAQAKRGRRWRP